MSERNESMTDFFFRFFLFCNHYHPMPHPFLCTWTISIFDELPTLSPSHVMLRTLSPKSLVDSRRAIFLSSTQHFLFCCNHFQRMKFASWFYGPQFEHM